MELLPERRILDGGRESFAIHIDWGGFTNKEIGDAMLRFAVNHRPKREDCKGPGQGGKRAKATIRSYLKSLSAMRIWKREKNQWRRMQLIAETCRYENCQRESAAYKKWRKEGRAHEPMDAIAKTEMSRARGQALKIFEDLFPYLDEQPANYGRKQRKKVNAK